MKKIIHLITSLEGGGTENFLHQILASSPPEHAHQVLFLKKDGVIGERLRRSGISVQPAGSLMSFYKTLRREKPDILHTCLYSAHQVGRILGTYAGVPAIITSQRSIDIWQKTWQTWLDRITLSQSDAIIANSHAAAEMIAHRRGKASRPELFEIPNGVDPSRFQRGDRDSQRLKLGLPLDAVIGGSLIRLHSEKGADFIPDLAGRLLPLFPKLHFLIGGVGPLEKSIRAALSKATYADRIHWVGWVDDTPSFLSACDYFWLLSREESFPQTLVEASMMGLPWVAPETGGVAGLLASGAAGLVYDRLDIRGAATQTTVMIQGLSSLTGKARKAVPSIQARYSLATMVAQVYEVFAQFPRR